MKKLLFFLTLFSVSHIAHGAEVSEQAKNNLWFSIVDSSKCVPQNMTPQDALDACKQEDNAFTLDSYILKYPTETTNNTLLHVAIINNNLANVTWIFEHITETTKLHLLYKKNKDQKTPLDIAVEEKYTEIANYILHNIDDMTRNTCLYNALNQNNTLMITLILQHKSFNPNFYFSQSLYDCIKKSVQETQSNYENITFDMYATSQKNPSTTYSATIDPNTDPISRALIELIRSNKCTSNTLARMLLTLLKKIHKVQGNLILQKTYTIDGKQYYGLIDAITKNQHFDKDKTLGYFIWENNHLTSPTGCTTARTFAAIEWLFNTFPDHQFADRSYIDDILDSHSLHHNSLTIIKLLIDHQITSISPQNYHVLKADQADDELIITVTYPDNESSELNLEQLTIDSWTTKPHRSRGLKAVSIAAVLYDFIRFKKPEKNDDKKDIKAKITAKSGTKKDIKKTDTKESKEKKELSRWKRLVKHTRNYKKDLLNNPRNHKKLAIPFACLLIRALKDKTPLKWY